MVHLPRDYIIGECSCCNSTLKADLIAFQIQTIKEYSQPLLHLIAHYDKVRNGEIGILEALGVPDNTNDKLRNLIQFEERGRIVEGGFENLYQEYLLVLILYPPSSNDFSSFIDSIRGVSPIPKGALLPTERNPGYLLSFLNENWQDSRAPQLVFIPYDTVHDELAKTRLSGIFDAVRLKNLLINNSNDRFYTKETKGFSHEERQKLGAYELHKFYKQWLKKLELRH